MAATGVMNIRIEPDIKDKAQVLAKRECQSLSGWIKRLIEHQVSTTEAAAQDSNASDTP